MPSYMHLEEWHIFLPDVSIDVLKRVVSFLYRGDFAAASRPEINEVYTVLTEVLGYPTSMKIEPRCSVPQYEPISEDEEDVDERIISGIPASPNPIFNNTRVRSPSPTALFTEDEEDFTEDIPSDNQKEEDDGAGGGESVPDESEMPLLEAEEPEMPQLQPETSNNNDDSSKSVQEQENPEADTNALDDDGSLGDIGDIGDIEADASAGTTTNTASSPLSDHTPPSSVQKKKVTPLKIKLPNNTPPTHSADSNNMEERHKKRSKKRKKEKKKKKHFPSRETVESSDDEDRNGEPERKKTKFPPASLATPAQDNPTPSQQNPDPEGGEVAANANVEKKSPTVKAKRPRTRKKSGPRKVIRGTCKKCGQCIRKPNWKGHYANDVKGVWRNGIQEKCTRPDNTVSCRDCSQTFKTWVSLAKHMTLSHAHNFKKCLKDDGYECIEDNYEDIFEQIVEQRPEENTGGNAGLEPEQQAPLPPTPPTPPSPQVSPQASVSGTQQSTTFDLDNPQPGTSKAG